MTLRHNLKCLTCGTIHTLRIAIGHGTRQEHSVICTNCGESMLIALNLDQENADYDIDHVSNCEQSIEPGTIVNLHPEFLVPKDLLHADFVSMNILAACHVMENAERIQSKMNSMSPQEHEKAKEFFNATLILEKEWMSLKKCWSQLIKGHDKIAHDIHKANKGKYLGIDDSPQAWIFSFALRVLSPGQKHLFDDAMKQIAMVRDADKNSFKLFLDWHAVNHFKPSLRRYFDIFENFFKCYSDFSQHFWTYKLRPDSTDGIVSSCKFSDTMRFYGDAFEALGSGIATLACISNIHKGRQFDTFNSPGFKLDDYLVSDKSNRTRCYGDIPEFAKITNKYDSSIRNGSHHGTFELDHKTMVVSFRPRKNPKIETITYSEYIDMCVSIFFSCATMLAIDIIMNHFHEKCI